jgi:hypothetical protein
MVRSRSSAEPCAKLGSVDFQEVIQRLGFRPRDERTVGAGGVQLYQAQPNGFMTYVVHTYDDGSAIFTWEFALGEYLATKGIQMGSDETLNQFIYPREDVRGRQEAAWLMGAVERTEAMVAAIRLDQPGG